MPRWLDGGSASADARGHHFSAPFTGDWRTSTCAVNAPWPWSSRSGSSRGALAPGRRSARAHPRSRSVRRTPPSPAPHGSRKAGTDIRVAGRSLGRLQHLGRVHWKRATHSALDRMARRPHAGNPPSSAWVSQPLSRSSAAARSLRGPSVSTRAVPTARPGRCSTQPIAGGRAGSGCPAASSARTRSRRPHLRPGPCSGQPAREPLTAARSDRQSHAGQGGATSAHGGPQREAPLHPTPTPLTVTSYGQGVTCQAIL
jgi:hypothetical protein